MRSAGAVERATDLGRKSMKIADEGLMGNAVCGTNRVLQPGEQVSSHHGQPGVLVRRTTYAAYAEFCRSQDFWVPTLEECEREGPAYFWEVQTD